METLDGRTIISGFHSDEEERKTRLSPEKFEHWKRLEVEISQRDTGTINIIKDQNGQNRITGSPGEINEWGHAEGTIGNTIDRCIALGIFTKEEIALLAGSKVSKVNSHVKNALVDRGYEVVSNGGVLSFLQQNKAIHDVASGNTAIEAEKKIGDDNIVNDDDAPDYMISEEFEKMTEKSDERNGVTYAINEMERLYATEEHCGIIIEGLSAIYDGPYLDGDMHAVVNAEIHARDGNGTKEDFHIVATAFDRQGKILNSAAEDFSAEDFFVLAPLKLHLPVKEKPARIRVYARKGVSDII